MIADWYPTNFADKVGAGCAALSGRERMVLYAYARVGTYKLIAYELGITVATVKNHVSSILAKLDCATIGQAAVRLAFYELGS
jgi:DNA-binding NarL/FixJ family response regulator